MFFWISCCPTHYSPCCWEAGEIVSFSNTSISKFSVTGLGTHLVKLFPSYLGSKSLAETSRGSRRVQGAEREGIRETKRLGFPEREWLWAGIWRNAKTGEPSLSARYRVLTLQCSLALTHTSGALSKAEDSWGQCLPLTGQMGYEKLLWPGASEGLGHFYSSGTSVSPLRSQCKPENPCSAASEFPVLILKPGRFWRRRFKASNFISPSACFTSGIQSLMLTQSMPRNVICGLGRGVGGCK